MTATQLVLIGTGLVLLAGFSLIVAGVAVAQGLAAALITGGVLSSTAAIVVAVVLLRDDST